MATGMEMLVNALVKASGVDPEKLRQDVAAYATGLSEKIASMDNCLTLLARDQAVILKRIYALEDRQRSMAELLEEIAREMLPGLPDDEDAAVVIINEEEHVTGT